MYDRARECAPGRKWHTATMTSAQQNNLHNMLGPPARLFFLSHVHRRTTHHGQPPSPTAHSALTTYPVAALVHTRTTAPSPRKARGTNAGLRTNLPLLADANSQRAQVGKPSTMCSGHAAKGHRHRGTDSSSTFPRESRGEDGWKRQWKCKQQQWICISLIQRVC